MDDVVDDQNLIELGRLVRGAMMDDLLGASPKTIRVPISIEGAGSTEYTVRVERVKEEAR